MGRNGVWVTAAVLAAFAAGCTSGAEPQEPPESSRSVFPTEATPSATEGSRTRAREARLAAFLDRARVVERGVVGPEFSLIEVHYTSSTDAAADFRNCDDRVRRVCSTIVATTNDNWAHAAALAIPERLADLVDYTPLGRGAVAIKAESSPPFVLYPNGKVKLLQVAEPRPLDAGSDLFDIDGLFLYAIHGVGAGESLRLDPLDQVRGVGTWAADVDAGEIFPVSGAPNGDRLWEHVPGRDGEVLSVSGYRRNVGDGVWRFAESTDSGHTWRRTDVRLPLGDTAFWRYAGLYMDAVGPGHLQAIAMAEWLIDLPPHLRELWRTNDEKEFRRVQLPCERTRCIELPRYRGTTQADGMAFGGMAFAADGALLVAEVTGSANYCQFSTCSPNRPGRIWRLPSGGTEMRLLPDAPRLFGPFWAVGIEPSGGLIVARTGLRTIAVSNDGYTWTKVSPGR